MGNQLIGTLCCIAVECPIQLVVDNKKYFLDNIDHMINIVY